MINNPLSEASPLAIKRIRNLLSDYDNCLNRTEGHPKDISRICKTIQSEFVKEFCELFGKRVTITEEGRGYYKLDVAPRSFDGPLSKWLSKVQAMVPKEGAAVEPTDQNCLIHSGEIQTLMNQIQQIL